MIVKSNYSHQIFITEVIIVSLKFYSGLFSDAGKVSSINQDAAVIYHIKYNKKHIIMAMVADGLGGHEKGEMASQLVANQVIRWFQQKVINNISELNSEHIVKELRNLAMQLNTRLYDAGQKDNLKMGTTLSLIIICENNYIYMNIGDSRIYMVGKSAIKITEDQSIWNQRTETRALTECVGITSNISPQIQIGKITSRINGFLICSDGFYHSINEGIMQKYLNRKFKGDSEIVECLKHLERYCEYKGENDNITAVYVKIKR